MNRILVFSWLNIMTFIAVILMAYLIYMGFRYTEPDNPNLAVIMMCIVSGLLLITFMGAQILKGSGYKPDILIRWERFIAVLAVIVFIGAAVMTFRFWNVFANRQEISEKFLEIEKSGALFDRYRDYATDRYNYYKYNSEDLSDISRENKLQLIDFTLHPKEVDELETNVKSWLSNAVEKQPTVWNVFLVGNASQMEEAITKWHELLVNVSRAHLSDEEYHIFDHENKYLDQAIAPIHDLKECYNPKNFTFSFVGFLVTILLLALLTAPYIFQRRNSKSIEGLFGRKKNRMSVKGGNSGPGLKHSGNSGDTIFHEFD